MCGIAGIIGAGDEKIIHKMAQSIKHRGPDEDGFFIDEKNKVFLGMRRLSIIDLKGGRQPIYNEDRSIAALYNGEIYNFQELRKELEEKGHKFYTNTDTEVIVHLYEEVGEDFVHKLNGMFAICLWDKNNQKLILARDRMGQKPLYYFTRHNTLSFSSEIKALHFLDQPISSKSVLNFVDQGYIAGEDTIFKGIKRLLPGHLLIYQKHSISIKKWWQQEKDSEDMSLNEVEERLSDLLEDAVRIRLIADVPLGVFLSGGIDSSLIAYYAQKNSKQKIKTFTVRFPYKSFDESDYARKAASVIQSEHIEEEVSGRELIDIVQNLPYLSDEPFADTSFIPTYILSQKTRKYVKVALGGDGADELFWGYQTFYALGLWKLLRKLPAVDLIRRIANYIPVSGKYFSLGFKIKRALLNFEKDPYNLHFRWFSSFTKDEIFSLFSPEFISSDEILNYFNYSSSFPLEDRDGSLENLFSCLYQNFYLPDDILMKVDKASMAVSLEARAPFLDFRIVNFANTLPDGYKFHKNTGKYILKKLAEKHFPPELVYRKKHGFAAPVGMWLRYNLLDLAEDLFSLKNLQNSGIFNTEVVRDMWSRFLQGDNYRERQIWTLFILLLYIKFFDLR